MTNVYIISYLGNSLKKQQLRYEAHKKQITWIMLNKCEDIDVTVLAMRWPSYYEISRPGVDNIHYRFIDEKLSPNAARNIFLREFYASDHNTCIFMDDDIKWKFNGEMNEHSFRIGVDRLNYVFDEYNFDIVNVSWVRNKKTFDTIRFHPMLFSSESFMMRNFKKFKNKEIYFDDEMIGFLPMGDFEFSLNCICNGMKSGCLNNPYSFSIAGKNTGSSFIEDNKENDIRKELMKVSKKLIAEKWKNKGFYFCNNGRLPTEFFKRNSIFRGKIEL